MADHLRTDLIADALTNAVAGRNPDPGVVFHSDRGCQYTSPAIRHPRRRLRGPPVGRPDRAVLGQRRRRIVLRLTEGRMHRPAALAHQDLARRAVVDYIAWYNGTRLHSTLGYLTPDEYEAAIDQDQDHLAQVA